jgi:hypothetical protein
MAFVRTYLVVIVLLLVIAVINNVIMYYKCYLNNNLEDPFIPENTGVYRVNIYYNKYRTPQDGIHKEIQPFLQPFVDQSYGRYVVTENRPSKQQYRQISMLSNYQKMS